MLKSSGSLILHTNSINVIFYNGLSCLVLRMASSLDAFSSYPYRAWLRSLPMRTARLEAPDSSSSRTIESFHSDNNTPSRYHTNCLAYFINDYVFSLCGLYHHPSLKKEISVLPIHKNKSST